MPVLLRNSPPDYSILERPFDHDVYIRARKSDKRFLICKEELGSNTQKGECQYEILPTFSAYSMVQPVFLVRDPIRVFDSWKSVGWLDVQSLVDCYTNIFRMFDDSPSRVASYLLYERLIREPETEVKRICTRWGVPFSESMLDFKQPFGSNFFFSSDRERSIYCEKKPLGLFSTVEASSSIIPDVPCHGLLSNTEKDIIEEHVDRLYIRCWEDDILRLRAILSGKTWFGFDLDDTLHEFRGASRAATNKTLERIAQQSRIDLSALREEYSRILKEKTASAFSDGKTSFHYRKERFVAVLEHFSIARDEQFLEELLQLYEATLMESLELKCGALGLLSTIKGLGKKIVVITEGPQDAQERTVQRLGISGYIDFLATTNHFRLTKTSGLFNKVLEHLGISPGDMAYVGDNEQRDIMPAVAEGIFSIHFAETKHFSLAAKPAPQIKTLRKLQYILSD